jgi:hypothetical protein
MNPIRLDYHAPSKRKPPRGQDASLIMRISDPRSGDEGSVQRLGRGFVYAIITIALLMLVGYALHFVVDYARLLDTMSR